MKLSYRMYLGMTMGLVALSGCKTKKEQAPDQMVTSEQIEAHKDSGHVMSLVTPGALAKTANGDLQYGPGTKETSWLENDVLFLSLPVERFPELAYVTTPIREVVVAVKRSDVKGLENSLQLTNKKKKQTAAGLDAAMNAYAGAVHRETRFDDATKLRIAEAARNPRPGESPIETNARILAMESNVGKTVDVNSPDLRSSADNLESAISLYADSVKRDARWQYRVQGGVYTFVFAGLVTALLVTNHMKGGENELADSRKKVEDLRKELDNLRAKQQADEAAKEKKTDKGDKDFDDWGLGLNLSGAGAQESFPVREADFGKGVRAYITSYVSSETAGVIDLTRSILLTGRHKVLDTEYQADCTGSCLVSVKE